MRKVYEYDGRVFTNRVDAVFCAKNSLHAKVFNAFTKILSKRQNIELINFDYHEVVVNNNIIEVQCFCTYWSEYDGIQLIARVDYVHIKDFIE